ncbi:class I SAM-dependent methyltransferase [Nocardiopsis metallicus]|uniref:SAM-dependent methyltransferase n=1 Tax=Nocardiopsis metallicus TaxID=179819 RepID=A0A840WS18_9ACTN|nr:class I SAM-dependent methyltransferase [Nocardiopsis metallicus]MBB5494357.1 SAM-dependent methyltransferase [Nocardiopsis metallicus]
MPEHTPRTSTGSVPNPRLYSLRNLRRYRRVVVGLSHRLAWKVDNNHIRDLYAVHTAPTHLEVGPADGHFLLNAPPPTGPRGEPVSVALRQIHLLDLNDAPLDYCAPKLAQHGQVIPHRHDVLSAPWPLPDDSVGSVAMFHVLHCVPGPSLRYKTKAFSEAARVLSPNGTFFGSTLLGTEDPHTSNNWLARRLQSAYNAAGRNIFHNTGDRLVDLRSMLDLHFARVELNVMGSAGVWVAREPRR